MLHATVIAAFIFATVLLVGCGDSELVKGITDVVKKSVEGEVSKKVGEVKKQFDQVVNLGVGKGSKEANQGDAKVDKKNLTRWIIENKRAFQPHLILPFRQLLKNGDHPFDRYQPTEKDLFGQYFNLCPFVQLC